LPAIRIVHPIACQNGHTHVTILHVGENAPAIAKESKMEILVTAAASWNTPNDRAHRVANRLALPHIGRMLEVFEAVTGRSTNAWDVESFKEARSAFARGLSRDGWMSVASGAPAEFWVGVDPMAVAFMGVNIGHLFAQDDFECFRTWIDFAEESGLASAEVIARAREIIATTPPASDARPVDLGDAEITLYRVGKVDALSCYVDTAEGTVSAWRYPGEFVHTEPVSTFPSGLLGVVGGEWTAGTVNSPIHCDHVLTGEDRLDDLVPTELADGEAFFGGRYYDDADEILRLVNTRYQIVWGGRWINLEDGGERVRVANEVLDFYGDPVAVHRMPVTLGGERMLLRRDTPLIDDGHVARVVNGWSPQARSAPAGWMAFELSGRPARGLTFGSPMNAVAWQAVPGPAPMVAIDPATMRRGDWFRFVDDYGCEVAARKIGPDTWAVVDTDDEGMGEQHGWSF
jgi:hypothetical protein